MIKTLITVLFMFSSGFCLASIDINSKLSNNPNKNEFNISMNNLVFSNDCKISLIECFEEAFYSKAETDVAAGILLYLDNFEVLSNHYPFELLLKKFNEVSKLVSDDLFLMEANIYLNGIHTPVDINKTIRILETNVFFEYQNPVHITLLGKAYWKKFISTEKKDIFSYTKARELLLKAYWIDKKTYSTATLASALISTNDTDDIELAGEILKYLASSETATENDIKRYDIYKKIKKKMMQE